MKKKIIHSVLLLLALVFIYSCKKEIKSTKICLHDSSIDYLKRWANVTTQTDNYDDGGILLNRKVVYEHGYFQINADFTYNLYSDTPPVDGKWSINENCQFVLNPNTNKEHRYSVIQLSADSLVIVETVAYTKVTRRFAALMCPTLASLQYRWDNIFSLQTSYKADTVSKAQYLYPDGYYRFNSDASYVFVSNATAGSNTPAPLPVNGTWGITQPGCLLVLDKNKPNEKSFDVQKLTTDSLVIWRKDTTAKANYLQHYAKHK